MKVPFTKGLSSCNHWRQETNGGVAGDEASGAAAGAAATGGDGGAGGVEEDELMIRLAFYLL
jgi:hypothetical protein